MIFGKLPAARSCTSSRGHSLAVVVLLAALGLFISCGHSPNDEAKREHDANTVAGKAGKAAYSVAKETGKAAQVVGKKVAEAAHDAHAGWKEASAEDKGKKK